MPFMSGIEQGLPLLNHGSPRLTGVPLDSGYELKEFRPYVVPPS